MLLKYLKTGVIFFIIIGCQSVYAAPEQIIKVGIIDNLETEKYGTDDYLSNYLKGIKTAELVANKSNIKIEYKTFFYGGEPLDIINKIPALKAWKPDFILGPRSSENFILLGRYFQNILVLSPLATSSETTTLPENFVSMSLPNKYVAQAVTNFIKKRYPGKNILILTEVNCDCCNDLSSKINSILSKNKLKDQVVTNKYFLSDEVDTVNVSKLTNSYQDDAIIVFPNDSYTSNLLIPRIMESLKNKKLVFIGADYWGSKKSSGRNNYSNGNLYDFVGFRFSPWALNQKNAEVEEFSKYYFRIYKELPDDIISFITYDTVMSVVEAYNIKGSGINGDISEKILQSYVEILKENPMWFKPNIYNIYEFGSNISGEKFIGTISSNFAEEKPYE